MSYGIEGVWVRTCVFACVCACVCVCVCVCSVPPKRKKSRKMYFLKSIGKRSNKKADLSPHGGSLCAKTDI